MYVILPLPQLLPLFVKNIFVNLTILPPNKIKNRILTSPNSQSIFQPPYLFINDLVKSDFQQGLPTAFAC